MYHFRLRPSRPPHKCVCTLETLFLNFATMFFDFRGRFFWELVRFFVIFVTKNEKLNNFAKPDEGEELEAAPDARGVRLPRQQQQYWPGTGKQRSSLSRRRPPEPPSGPSKWLKTRPGRFQDTLSSTHPGGGLRPPPGCVAAGVSGSFPSEF